MADPAGLRIGTFAGAPVIVEPTILILAIYILATSVIDAGVSALPNALVLLAAVIIAVIIHEFAHAAAAAALKIPSKRIVLTFFGGYVQFAWPPTKRWHEIVVSAAGPLSNLACAGLIIAAAWTLQPQMQALTQWPLAAQFVDNFFFLSALLGAFNLLPGHPLDGGHILRAGLTYVMPQRAARIAAGCGGVLVALGLGAYAIFGGLAWTGLMAIFLALAAWSEIKRATEETPT